MNSFCVVFTGQRGLVVVNILRLDWGKWNLLRGDVSQRASVTRAKSIVRVLYLSVWFLREGGKKGLARSNPETKLHLLRLGGNFGQFIGDTTVVPHEVFPPSCPCIIGFCSLVF